MPRVSKQTRWLQKKALVSVGGYCVKVFLFFYYYLSCRCASIVNVVRGGGFFGCQPLLVVRRLQTGRELTRTLKLMRVLDASQSSSELMLLRRPQGINPPPEPLFLFSFLLSFFSLGSSPPESSREGAKQLPWAPRAPPTGG